METKALELRVGVFLAAAILVLIGFVFVLGNFSLSSGYSLYVDYRFSGNLRAGAPVKLSGIKVGKVEDVTFTGGNVASQGVDRTYVRVRVWIEDQVRDAIRQDAEFYINTAGVLGEQYLEIVPGESQTVLPAESAVRGADPPRTDLVVSRLYQVLDSLAVLLKDDREVITNMLRNGGEAAAELNRFLSDNRAALSTFVVEGTELADEAGTLLAKANQGIRDPRAIGRTIQRAEQLLATADQSLKSLSPPAREFLVDANRVTALVTQARVERTLRVADEAVDTLGKAGGLIDQGASIVGNLSAGKGTAGALLTREEIYADLREMLRDLRRNPWKFFWKE